MVGGRVVLRKLVCALLATLVFLALPGGVAIAQEPPVQPGGVSKLQVNAGLTLTFDQPVSSEEAEDIKNELGEEGGLGAQALAVQTIGCGEVMGFSDANGRLGLRFQCFRSME